MLPQTNALLHWYAIHKRQMPWRDVADPYRVWVSEIMLQQTRVETVVPYYLRWMELFPTVAALAAASQPAVLKAWEGLGYYSRARKLHEGAQAVMERFGGRLPGDESQLATLPGVGPYTAAAMASFAFGADALPVDGNLNRVLARLCGTDLLAGSKEFMEEVRRAGWKMLPTGRSADYNQALMDLGSMVCTPMAPACGECPLAEWCASKSNPMARPRKPAKATVPTKYKIALVATRNGQVLLVQRPHTGLLGGMWEFPAVEVADLMELDREEAIRRMMQQYGITVDFLRVAMEVKHAYSHFRLVEQAWLATAEVGQLAGQACWVPVEQTGALAMGKVDRAIANRLAEW